MLETIQPHKYIKMDFLLHLFQKSNRMFYLNIVITNVYGSVELPHKK